MQKISTKHLLIAVLAISFLLRIWRIDYPNIFVFDEVYYPYTAQQYLKGNSDAWLWDTKAPDDKAYNWVNPPLAQEIMAGSMFILRSQDAWAWRLPSVLLGTLCIYLVYILGKLLFKIERVALLSALIFSIDGLNFVNSRIGMLDIYLVTFILMSSIFFIKRKFFLSAIFLGLALGSKWTAVYLLALYILLLFKYRLSKKIPIYILVVPIIYVLIYLPFFLTGHTLSQFVELLRQEWSYHTNLTSVHDYASPWWSWPLTLYPVWYFVDYQKDNIANIFASGNQVVFWLGSIAIIKTGWDYFKTRAENLLVILLMFFALWLPWSLSPRLMFFYYFSPSVPFLSLALGYQIHKLYQNSKTREVAILMIILMIIWFIMLFPFLTGIPLPKSIVQLFFSINLAKNPF